jgi:hypothetical protein
MKTKKELEKEIEKLKKFYNYNGKSKYNKVNQLQAQLTQTIEMKKEIKEMIDKIVNGICKDVSFDEMWIIDRLRKEFKQVEKL